MADGIGHLQSWCRGCEVNVVVLVLLWFQFLNISDSVTSTPSRGGLLDDPLLSVMLDTPAAYKTSATTARFDSSSQRRQLDLLTRVVAECCSAWLVTGTGRCDIWLTLMPATHAQETFTRNLCKSSCTRNLHMCRSILYKFFSGTSFLHITEQLYSSTETVQHVTQTVQCDWPKLWWTYFCYKFLERVSPALDSTFITSWWHFRIRHRSIWATTASLLIIPDIGGQMGLNHIKLWQHLQWQIIHSG